MSRKIVGLSLIVIIFSGLFIQYQIRAPRRNYSDYSCFYKAGKDILQGKNPYIKDSEEISTFKYTPIFALFMAPLAIFDQKTSASLFFLLNLCAVFFIFSLSRKLIFFKEISANSEFFLFVLVSLINFRFVLNCLHSAQVGLFIMLAVVSGLFFISKAKNAVGASFIGIAIMIKYMPALFIPYFFIKMKFKISFLILVAVVIYCLLPGLFIGLKYNFFLLKELIPHISSTSLGEGAFFDEKMQSLWAFPFRAFTGISSFSATVFTLCIFVILTLFIVISNKKQIKKEEELFTNCLDYGLVFILIPLFNPHGWIHNFVTLIFPTMLVIYYLMLCNFKDKLVLSLVLVYFVLTTFGSPSFVGEAMQTILERFSIVIFGSLFLFAAIVKIKFRSMLSMDKEN